MWSSDVSRLVRAVSQVHGALHVHLGLLGVVDQDSVALDGMLEDRHDGRLLAPDAHLVSHLIQDMLRQALRGEPLQRLEVLRRSCPRGRLDLLTP